MPEDSVAVRLITNHGAITLELDRAKAPISVENFLGYVEEGFFNDTIFHRVIDGFMIQGGGFTADMEQKETNAPIKNEADNGLTNDLGTIAMARTQIVDSATAQFFINIKDNDFLNHRNTSAEGYGYAVFGKVSDGMDTVDAIRKVATGSQGHHQDVPQEPVVIERAELV